MQVALQQPALYCCSHAAAPMLHCQSSSISTATLPIAFWWTPTPNQQQPCQAQLLQPCHCPTVPLCPPPLTQIVEAVVEPTQPVLQLCRMEMPNSRARQFRSSVFLGINSVMLIVVRIPWLCMFLISLMLTWSNIKAEIKFCFSKPIAIYTNQVLDSVDFIVSISVPEELQNFCLENKELVWLLQQTQEIYSCFNSHKF